MSQLLKYNTNSQVVKLGPIRSLTDGSLATNALSIANTDIMIGKHGATAQVAKNSGGATFDANGVFYATFSSSDTDTLGNIEINVIKTGYICPTARLRVATANEYDSKFGDTVRRKVDIDQIGATTQSATDLKDFADTGYDPATHKVEAVKALDNAATLTQMEYAVWDSMKADHILADSLGEHINNLPGLAAQIAGILGALTTGYGAGTVGGKIDNIPDVIPTIEDLVDAIDSDSAQLSAIILAIANVPAEVWSVTLEGTRTALQMMRIVHAIARGKTTGAGTGTMKFRDLADAKDRVTATLDSSGNRTNIVEDVS